MADFPDSVKSFATLVDLVDDVLAAHQNERGDEITAVENYLIEAPTEKTVASGVLTVDKSRHKIQPESGTADDIDTISGMPDNSHITLYASDAGTDTLTFKHGTGNISCFSGSDINLSRGFVLGFFDGTTVYLAGGASKYSVVFGGHGNGGTVPAASTNYIVPMITGLDTVGRSYPIPKSGTLKNLFIRTGTAQPGTGSLVVEILAGASGTTATGIKITIAAGAGSATYSNVANTYAHTAGDLVTVRIINNASGASAVIGGVSFEVEAQLT